MNDISAVCIQKYYNDPCEMAYKGAFYLQGFYNCSQYEYAVMHLTIYSWKSKIINYFIIKLFNNLKIIKTLLRNFSL